MGSSRPRGAARKRAGGRQAAEKPSPERAQRETFDLRKGKSDGFSRRVETVAGDPFPSETREFLFECLDRGRFLMVVLDRNGRVLWKNSTFKALAFEGHDDWDGTFQALLHEADAASVSHILAFPEGQVGAVEFRHPIPTGMKIVSYQFFPCPGGTVIGVGSDRTEEKEMITQLETAIEDLHQEVARRVELSRRLQELARTDFLTGLANRRQFDEVLRQEWGRVRRYGSQFALILFDLDRFKEVNDRFGHQVGDEALKRVAEVLKAEVRSEDIVARYGGEEFAVIALGADKSRGRELAERLRHRVAGSPMPAGMPGMTMSAGVSSTAGGDAPNDPSVLIARADEALYRAKNLGRNRVEAV
jgi:diguanylate cyclase (GGDEF)-like protein